MSRSAAYRISHRQHLPSNVEQLRSYLFACQVKEGKFHIWIKAYYRAKAGIAEAVERQTALMWDLSRRAFPEPDVVLDDETAPIEQARLERRRQTAATEAAALRRARAERAAREGQQ
ncbi:hypothetical protein [Streptomyces griseosporeus]|uniref:hypothetical protein n=1 Tax=Streptomyces griseosporeus TaxID=1910 RepID=UPI0037019967